MYIAADSLSSAEDLRVDAYGLKDSVSGNSVDNIITIDSDTDDNDKRTSNLLSSVEGLGVDAHTKKSDSGNDHWSNEVIETSDSELYFTCRESFETP